jgi:hypothetical protein
LETIWAKGVDEIKGEVNNFFENNFNERWEHRPNLNGLIFQSLNVEDNITLLEPFSLEEVKEII